MRGLTEATIDILIKYTALLFLRRWIYCGFAIKLVEVYKFGKFKF